jgi:mycofactocin precursor
MASPVTSQHPDRTQQADDTQADVVGELIEEVSIDGMCGVY